MEQENENKGRVGRPPIETKLPEAWKEIIIEAGKNGEHITDFLITLGISYQSHYRLLKKNLAYRHAVEEYEKYCEQFWYSMAKESMVENGGVAFNSRLWSLIMRNKFSSNWSESSKVDVTSQNEKINTTPITIEIVKPKGE